ncbi:MULTISPECIES: protein DpdG [Pseudomonas]|uniref:Uncharacterized protein n=1 Tax=Pseudomonas fluorescens TaxID=294 RepID=A0A166R3K3_PSEFL|nr:MULTISPECIES: protein DpdG [Pseudomonas]KZN21250.1 hypothetical protein A1D17_02140 [Pseudomonas fluorescens]
MSILNLASDGLPSIIQSLAQVVAQNQSISRDDLIRICVPGADMDASRARQTLTRWISLGLFSEDGDEIRLAVELKRGEPVDTFALDICRHLALRYENGLPLWPVDGNDSEVGAGRTADLCRSLAWCLAQDIYSLPNSPEEVESLATAQIKAGSFIFKNKSNRWPGFCAWARFLGFASGYDSAFLCDPTVAVRSALQKVIHQDEVVPAAEFVSRLATHLPVLDSGAYRLEVEQVLKPEMWTAPAAGHLSTALSFALRRLQMQGTISLVTLADAGSRLTLVGQGGRTWDSFTHVRLMKDAS